MAVSFMLAVIMTLAVAAIWIFTITFHRPASSAPSPFSALVSSISGTISHGKSSPDTASADDNQQQVQIINASAPADTTSTATTNPTNQ